MNYSDVGFWHGTGRYKYENGEVADVLGCIVADGGLIPHTDDWDMKRGMMQTISTARSRSYARLYASLFFPPGKRTIKELVLRLVWSCQFFLTSKWVAWQEYPPPQPHILNLKKKLAAWTVKLAKRPQSFAWLFLWGGTDIPGNYPILIGIRKGAVHPTRGSRFIDLHEDRSEQPIRIADFTHVEVPAEYVKEVSRFLENAGYTLPVISLESGNRNKL
jgi:hypothetical protein